MDLEQASAKIFEFLDSKLEGLDAMGVLLATEQDPNDYTIDKNTPKKKKKGYSWLPQSFMVSTTLPTPHNACLGLDSGRKNHSSD